MKWNTPQYEEKRFGFEVTMYIDQNSNLAVTLARRALCSAGAGRLGLGRIHLEIIS